MDYANLEPIHAVADLEENVSDNALEALFGTKKGKTLLCAVPYFFLKEDIPQDCETSANVFVVIVREMSCRYREGSDIMSRTLNEGYALRKAGNAEEAKLVYENFIKTCNIPFYLDIARIQLAKLDDQICRGSDHDKY